MALYPCEIKTLKVKFEDGQIIGDSVLAFAWVNCQTSWQVSSGGARQINRESVSANEKDYSVETMFNNSLPGLVTDIC